MEKYGVSKILGMEMIVTELANQHAFLLDRSIFESITGKRIWDRNRIRREMLGRKAYKESVERIRKLNIRSNHDFHPSI